MCPWLQWIGVVIVMLQPRKIVGRLIVIHSFRFLHGNGTSRLNLRRRPAASRVEHRTRINHAILHHLYSAYLIGSQQAERWDDPFRLFQPDSGGCWDDAAHVAAIVHQGIPTSTTVTDRSFVGLRRHKRLELDILCLAGFGHSSVVASNHNSPPFTPGLFQTGRRRNRIGGAPAA